MQFIVTTLHTTLARYRLMLCYYVPAVLILFLAYNSHGLATTSANEKEQTTPLKELAALTAEAEALEGGKDLVAFNSAWQAVKEKAIEIYGEDHIEVRYIDSELAFQYFYTGEYKRAFDIIAPLADELAQKGKAYDYKRILLTQKLVPLYTNLGQGDKAILLQEESLAYWRASNNESKHKHIINSLNNLSSAKLQRGAHLEALKYADEALDIIANNEGLALQEPYILYNRTNYLAAAGRNSEAMEATRLGIRRMAERGEKKHLINGFLLTSLATQLHYQGRYKASIEASKSSIAVLQDIYGPHAPRVYQVQTVLLGLLIKQGEYTKAIRLANSLLPVLKESDGQQSRNYLFFKMGKHRAEFLAKPSQERLQAYSMTINEYESILGKDNRFSVSARTNEMLLTAQLRDYKGAHERAVAIQQQNEKLSKAESLAAKNIDIHAAFYKLMMGNSKSTNEIYAIYEQVKSDFEAKLQISDKTLTPNLVESGIFQVALKAAIQAQNFEKALEIAQIYTHGGPRTALAKANARVQALPKNALQKIRERQNLFEQQASKIVDRDAASRNKNNDLVLRLSNEIDLIAKSLLVITNDLANSFPQWIKAEKIQFANSNSIQAKLSPQDALVMPIVLDNGLVVFSFTQDKTNVDYVPLNALILKQWVDEFRHSISETSLLSTAINTTSEKNAFNKNLAKTQDASRKIYDAIFTENTKQLIISKSMLYISSNRYLSTIPFAALATNKSTVDRPHYLLDDFATSTVPYVGALSLDGQHTKLAGDQRRYVGIGAPNITLSNDEDAQQLASLRSVDTSAIIESLPPLPNAERELNTIAKLGFGKVILLTGSEAKESVIKQLQFAKDDLIVFASHGLLAGELEGINEPALILAPNEKEDGILTAREIAQMNFSSSFVVLSACNTGGEGGGSAEGLSGLASSFLYAGAKGLLVSHWPIRDDAAAFVTMNTIKNTQRGLSKAKALQKAMLDLRSNTTIAYAQHPAIWSSFVLVSD